MRASYARNGLIAGSHTADQVTRCAAAVERVRALLARQPLSSRMIADILELSTSTVNGYLMHLASESMACKTGQQDETGRQVVG
jgi:predicted transcriptional regulator